MKLWMRIVVPFTAVMSIAVGAKAQMWGAGVYGGMQACPYDYQAGAAASSYTDEIREAESMLENAQRQLRAKKSEKKRVDRELERHQKAIEDVVDSSYTDVIFNHMSNGFSCSEYTQPPGAGDTPVVDGEEGGRTVINIRPERKKQSYDPFTADQWFGEVCGEKGIINKSVCTNYRDSEGGRRSGSACAKGITEYRKISKASGKLQNEIEALEDQIQAAKDDKRLAQQNAKDELADRRREQLEGDVCIDCLRRGNSYSYQKPQTDWASVIGNVGLGLASVYMGYRTNKMISSNNANLGWPTDPWAAQGYGYGLGAIGTGMNQVINGGSGIYGSIGGGIGQGGFGCAGMNGGPMGMMGPYGGMNGNGMWGNPYGMAGMGFPGMGGGMYMPGMGPWGMAGPWGGMGMGYPGGMMMGGMMGGPMGGGMMGYPMGGGMMGYPMGGMMGGPMGSMMGGMLGGMMGGPMGGGMMGYPMGGGMMGYPMGGGMLGGMMGGPMGSMMGGAMMGGMLGGPMGTMMGGPMGGMLGGGMMMGGGMMGYPMGGGMMMGGMMGGLDMQQQMMQMQMQQYQMYMQQQQAYVQQQMQRQQVVASLQQELYGLLFRIQQVQYGGSTGYIGGSIGGGIGGGIGIGTNMGGGITPLPGSSGGGLLPGTGTGSAAPIPAPR